MKFYWIKTNTFIRKIFPNYIWNYPNEKNKIYLTFDDGPTPEITDWVLEELKKHQAKATFFCIGKNIEQNPTLFQRIKNNGHLIGNHTYNHLNGWKTSTIDYISNIDRCEQFIPNKQPEINLPKQKIFRPPYGKIRKTQAKRLKQFGYKIIMWDVLSADFDLTVSPEKCFENVLNNATSGSIIVFHDSVKAYKNLKYALPLSLKALTEKGFEFDLIK